MTDIERLAVAQAVFKVVAEQVSTKNPDSIRSQADETLMRMYEQMGVKSIDLKIDGEKVGTYSIQMAKATKETHHATIDVKDAQKVRDWVKDNEAEFNEWLDSAWGAFAEWCLIEYGEVPDGCEVTDHVTPARPEQPKGTTLRVDPPKVAHALGGRLPETIAGFLEGGE